MGTVRVCPAPGTPGTVPIVTDHPLSVRGTRGWGHPLTNPGAEGWQSGNTAAVPRPQIMEKAIIKFLRKIFLNK